MLVAILGRPADKTEPITRLNWLLMANLIQIDLGKDRCSRQRCCSDNFADSLGYGYPKAHSGGYWRDWHGDESLLS